ncbi:MAG: hypothetical protein WEA09_08820 [Gemmatimonadota bacterium]
MLRMCELIAHLSDEGDLAAFIVINKSERSAKVNSSRKGSQRRGRAIEQAFRNLALRKERTERARELLIYNGCSDEWQSPISLARQLGKERRYVGQMLFLHPRSPFFKATYRTERNL